MGSIRARLAVTGGLASVAIATLAASAQQVPPQFRSGVDLVTLDLTAVRADGTVVTDLRPDEVMVTIDGQPRTIRTFQFVEIAGKAVVRGAATAPAAIPAPATASAATGAQGRIVYVVLFHEHVRPGNERQAMLGVARIVDQLGPNDRVGIVTMPFGRVEVELTSDHARVKKRLPQIVGHSEEAAPTGAQTTSEALDLLAFLKSIIPLEGPKTIVLISEGFQNGDGLFPDRVNPEWADAVLLANTASMQAEISDLRAATAAARAQFYVLQPGNLATDAAFKQPRYERLDRATVRAMGENQTRALASFTSYVGGQFFQISGTAAAVADRIVRETSGYYAMAFETAAADRNRTDGNVRVRTSRAGVVLRARRTFPELNRGNRALSVAEVLTDSRPYTAIAIRAGASVTRAADGKVKVLALADPGEHAVKEVGFTLFDARNATVASWPADQPSGAGPIVSAHVVPPGHYRLRAAAIDANGAAGAADCEFDAALTPIGPLLASSLMTGVQQGTAFKPRLSFTPGDDLVVYAEIYDGTSDVDVVVELTSRAGGAVAARMAADLGTTREADRRIISATLPLRRVPAGDYVVQVVVRTAVAPPGTLTARIIITP